LKIVTSRKQLSSLPRNFYCEIPSSLSDEIENAASGKVLDIGVEWATAQAQELIDKGVPSVHFYIMQKSKAINSVLAKLKT
jgi:methylenetetrahydrofolate reductase (NADPH)